MKIRAASLTTHAYICKINNNHAIITPVNFSSNTKNSIFFHSSYQACTEYLSLDTRLSAATHRNALQFSVQFTVQEKREERQTERE